MNLDSLTSKEILFMRKPQPYGGPGSFQRQLETQFLEADYKIKHFQNFKFRKFENIIVFSSTKHIFFLVYQYLLGSNIILRLDGLNKKHKYKKVNIFYFIYSELDNLLTYIIAQFIASVIIFQSEYILNNWKQRGLNVQNKKIKVILNGVDTNQFYPMNKNRYEDKICVVEGSIDDLVSVNILNNLKIECHVYGKIDRFYRDKITNDFVKFFGVFSRDEMPGILNDYKVFLMLEVNPPCPNSLIEAMSCGLIPVSYKSGSVCEIVTCTDAFLIEYDGNPEKYDIPNIDTLNSTIQDAIKSFEYSTHLYRNLVIEKMNIKNISMQYLSFLIEAF
jgi:glycosyltransferase involved in cell wall biosynthesis